MLKDGGIRRQAERRIEMQHLVWACPDVVLAAASRTEQDTLQTPTMITDLPPTTIIL